MARQRHLAYCCAMWLMQLSVLSKLPRRPTVRARACTACFLLAETQLWKVCLRFFQQSERYLTSLSRRTRCIRLDGVSATVEIDACVLTHNCIVRADVNCRFMAMIFAGRVSAKCHQPTVTGWCLSGWYRWYSGRWRVECISDSSRPLTVSGECPLSCNEITVAQVNHFEQTFARSINIKSDRYVFCAKPRHKAHAPRLAAVPP